MKGTLGRGGTPDPASRIQRHHLDSMKRPGPLSHRVADSGAPHPLSATISEEIAAAADEQPTDGSPPAQTRRTRVAGIEVEPAAAPGVVRHVGVSVDQHVGIPLVDLPFDLGVDSSPVVVPVAEQEAGSRNSTRCSQG